ncbi:MAG TPA: hypothetical protein VH518_05330 [Tepidisphaeraceae bacterium]|jgi:hypothetical protein
MRDTAPGANDCFRPPEVPIQVYCTHCHHEFESYLMQWVRDPTYAAGGFWACPTPGCSGKGFTFDVWPTDPDWALLHEGLMSFNFLEDADVVEEIPPSGGWLDEQVDDDVEDENAIDDELVGDDEIVDGEDDVIFPADKGSYDDELYWEEFDRDFPTAPIRPPDTIGFDFSDRDDNNPA